MNVTIRKLKQREYGLLKDFLYEAIFLQENEQAPPRTILLQPELQLYTHAFGKKDDHAFAIEVDGNIVGIVWARIMKDYGHIDEKTPSLAMSLYKEYRGIGLGTRLLKHMLKDLKRKGYDKVSLSVQKNNYAFKMYQSLGFKVVESKQEEYLMVYNLKSK